MNSTSRRILSVQYAQQLARKMLPFHPEKRQDQKSCSRK